jgi:hypothetical protein
MKNYKKLLVSFLVSFSVFSLNVNAAVTLQNETLPIVSDNKQDSHDGEDLKKRVHLQFSPEAVVLVGPIDKAQGLGVGGAVIYGLTPYFGMGGGLRQTFVMDNYSKLAFTQFDLRFVVAYNGSLIFDDLKSLKTAPKSRLGGFRTQVYVNQYYLSREAAPYTGFGLGSTYEIAVASRINYFFGGRFDRINNGITTLYPLQALVGIGFRL